MNLPKHLFWEANYNNINWDEMYQFVICRVLEYGSMEDWYEIKKYYGIEKIIHAAINSRSLSIKTMHFISNLFEVPLEKFRCYSLTLSDQIHWMY